ncbi:MAG TPA: polysaccharide biosynthesis protein [Bacteroidales bacterium]|nr:polysaccharide biosynthesis protein [Bacteroidales bacterium]
MGKLKTLAGQTAIYGLSSMLGRLLNYLLVPLHTRVFATEQFGVITELYAYATFIMIVLTYGMETGYFRFSETEKDENRVYSTSLIALLSSSFLFILITSIFSGQIADFINYSDHAEYITWFGIIMAADAFTAIPFARLRQKRKAWKFAFYKILNISINILGNLFFLVLCPWILKHNPDSFISNIYSPEIGVGYVFISNLIASVFTILLLLPEMMKIKMVFDSPLLKKMLRYSLPLLVAGLAGMINEALDRVMLKRLLSPDTNVMSQLGIYGANYKVAVLMTLFIQMFRYAAEPFFFSEAKSKDAKKMYADVMKFFIVFCLLIFMGVMFYIDIVKHFIGAGFHEGIKIVPIILMANLFLGIIINLSIWYKLTNYTRYGAYIAIFGAVITILLNVLLVPLDNPYFGGYMGAAWTHFICYFLMMILSYFMGQKYYKIKYDLKTIFIYIGVAVGFFFLAAYLRTTNFWLNIGFGTMLLLIFILFVVWKENLVEYLVRGKGGKRL